LILFGYIAEPACSAEERLEEHLEINVDFLKKIRQTLGP
jgi:hypothetical protein